VLFLNPDARIDVESVARLASVLEGDERVGAVAPRIVADDGTLDFSLRRFPRLRSTFGRALFLHRLFPDAQWVDEVVREPAAYARPSDAEWTSGACLLVRRSALELVGGFDEGFFLYCEDTDLCRRLWDAGYSVRYEPAAEAVHEGGVSAPRTSLLGTLVASRLRYARKHAPPAVRTLERVGLAVEELLRTVVGGGGAAARRGHAAALRVALAGRPGRAARSRG
jgi:GT2 family glycosyltransferase